MILFNTKCYTMMILYRKEAFDGLLQGEKGVERNYWVAQVDLFLNDKNAQEEVSGIKQNSTQKYE